MNRSQAAFILSSEKMFENCNQVYFWTFTFKDVLCDWEASKAWHCFWMDFTSQMGRRFWGLRVAEYHESHGVHFHVLLNRRVWAPEMRRIASRYGFGRINVKTRYKDAEGKWRKVDKGAGKYLAKYLGKGKSMKIRKWAAIGKGWAIRSSDVKSSDEWSQLKVLMYGERKINGCEAAQVSRNLARSKTYNFKRLKKYSESDLHVLHPMASYSHEHYQKYEQECKAREAVEKHEARCASARPYGVWGNGLEPDSGPTVGGTDGSGKRVCRSRTGGIGRCGAGGGRVVRRGR